MSARICVLVSIWLSLLFLPVKAMGCAGHLYFDPDKMGFFGGRRGQDGGTGPAGTSVCSGARRHGQGGSGSGR